MPSKKRKQKGFTPLQIFALSYLYSQELEKVQKEQALDQFRLVTHHSQSGIIGAPISISLRELATLIPSSLLPTPIPTTEEVYNQLKMLEDMDCLEEQNRYGYASEYSSFSIKSTGIMLVKKIFGDLSDKVKDKNAYQQAIGSTEGNSETKNWVRGLWDSLKEKAQDEIADEVLSGVKTYGPQLLLFLLVSYSSFTNSSCSSIICCGLIVIVNCWSLSSAIVLPNTD